MTGEANNETPDETPVTYGIYRLYDSAAILLKAGRGTMARGIPGVHRDAKRMLWWPEVDESRTTLEPRPDRSSDEVDDEIQSITEANLPPYNRRKRAGGRKTTTKTTAAKPTTRGTGTRTRTEAPQEESAQDRLTRRREDAARVAAQAPRRGDEICVGDFVWCLPLRDEAQVVEASMNHDAFVVVRRDGRVWGPPAVPVDLIPRAKRGPFYPSTKELDRLYVVWKRRNWPFESDPFPPPAERQQA